MISITKIKLIPVVLIISLIFINGIFSQFNSEIECFSILAGKHSTNEGEVLLAHNEDDWGDLLVNWYKVPARDHSPDEKITLQYGAKIPQVKHTYSYLWIEMPGMKFSDSYMNEWGVTIVSDQCRSRENNAVIINGGIGYYLRRIMAERAKTAKEAIKLAGGLIEDLGYNYSGRTYCIADPNEAWMMAVVKGKHWVAQRVPNDEIAVIANCYTIDKIDLSDTTNFLASKDIVDYAIERGWYDPATGKDFSFKNAYSLQSTINAIWNKPRAMAAINYLTRDSINYENNFPFSFKPKNNLDKTNLMKILASHLEGTDFESCQNKNPHFNIASRVCSPGNQYGFVAELRNGMPKEIANVIWTAIKRPCIQPYIPWYFGIENIPDDYTYKDWENAIDNHFKRTDLKTKTSKKAYWAFKKLVDITDKNYFELTGILKHNKKNIERELLSNQAEFEQNFINRYKQSPQDALKLLNDFEIKILISSLERTKEVLNLIED